MRHPVAALLALSFVGSTSLADEAVIYLPTALAARVEAGTRAGSSVALELRHDGAVATVACAVRALSVGPDWESLNPQACGDAAALRVPAVFTPPRELAGVRATARTPFEAVMAVVEFVSSRITNDERDDGPQDAASVLARRRGRCSGRANLAVGLLRAAGIPARTVLGVVVGRDGARWHRWGEAWMGGAGWVAFDPGASVGLVSVRYLAVTGAGEGSTLAGVRLERLDERGFAALPVRSGMRVVPVGGITVRCVARERGAPITALLVGPDGSRWARRGRGVVTFAGMLPGRYRLVWHAAGIPETLNLRLGDEREVRVDLSTVAEAGT